MASNFWQKNATKASPAKSQINKGFNDYINGCCKVLVLRIGKILSNVGGTIIGDSITHITTVRNKSPGRDLDVTKRRIQQDQSSGRASRFMKVLAEQSASCTIGYRQETSYDQRGHEQICLKQIILWRSQVSHCKGWASELLAASSHKGLWWGTVRLGTSWSVPTSHGKANKITKTYEHTRSNGVEEFSCQLSIWQIKPFKPNVQSLPVQNGAPKT